MLDLEQLLAQYPEPFRGFKRNILREYLQYKILEAVYGGKKGPGLVFMGGTAIHLVHGSPRFSEGLDFDNKDLDPNGLEGLAEHVGRELGRLGLAVENRVSRRGAWRIDLRIPTILYESGLSRLRDEKLAVHLDMEPQEYDYEPECPLLNRFDVFTQVLTVPRATLLAQKLCAILSRPRPLGRDFFDAVYLMGITKPDIRYLTEKNGIETPENLKKELLSFCRDLDFKALAQDVAPFLFSPADTKRVLLFEEYVRGYAFG